jgi:hypothetical protein
MGKKDLIKQLKSKIDLLRELAKENSSEAKRESNRENFRCYFKGRSEAYKKAADWLEEMVEKYD